jgi:YfiH family protein
VLTADCLAIALATPEAVAMVHAGWRGLADGVLEHGIAAVRELGGTDGPLTAAIGPAAGGCCYEVGDEVREAFGHALVGGAAPIDLKHIARDRLEQAGAAAVHDVGLCTMCGGAGLFFSHRRDRGRTGRQAGVVWRSSSKA